MYRGTWKVLTFQKGVEPRYMGISPIYAIPKVLEQSGLTKEDVDLYEVNEQSRS